MHFCARLTVVTPILFHAFQISEICSDIFWKIMLNLILLTVDRSEGYWLGHKTSEMYFHLFYVEFFQLWDQFCFILWNYSIVCSQIFFKIMLNLILSTVGKFGRYYLEQNISEIFVICLKLKFSQVLVFTTLIPSIFSYIIV